MKKFLFLILLVGLAGGAYWWQADRAQSEAALEAPVTVPVKRGDLAISVLATGSIESESLVSVIARESGQIEKLTATLGQAVKAGDVLALLESSDQKNEVLQAEADIHQIEAQKAAKLASLTQAEKALDRAAQLSAKDLGSKGELETAEAQVAMIKADIDGLDAQRARADVTLANAELALDRTTIRAPMDGTVITIIATEGQMVATGQDSATIMKIADMSKMVAKVEVSEADVIRVAPGQAATLTLLGDPTSAIDATVRIVEPAPTSLASSASSATDQAVYYNAVLDVANDEGKLRIGMTVQATITLDARQDVLTLVASTLGRPDKDGVYTVAVWNPATKSAEARQVTVGLNNNVTVEVLSGLNEGDLVVAERGDGSSAAISIRRPRGLGF